MIQQQELTRLARYESLIELSNALNRSSDVSGLAETFAAKLKYVADVSHWRYLGTERQGDAPLAVDGCRGSDVRLFRVDAESLEDLEGTMLANTAVYAGEALKRLQGQLPSGFRRLPEAQVYVCPQFVEEGLQSVVLYGTEQHTFDALDLKFLSLASHLLAGKIRQAQVEQQLLNELSAKVQSAEKMRELENRVLVQERMASLGNLVAGVAHELNTPLGALRGGQDTLLRAAGKLKATVSESRAQEAGRTKRIDSVLGIISDSSDVMTAATERLGAIVRSLMSFASVDQAAYQTVDVHAGIENALTLLASRIGDRIEIERHYGTIEPLYCATGQLNQVFMHVVRNALDAIEGEGRVEVTTSMHGESIKIQVTDTGVGMSPEMVRKIFDFGFRQESRVRMGFGLFLVHKIVDDHGGTLDVESEPGKGTSVTISLPIQNPKTPCPSAGSN